MSDRYTTPDGQRTASVGRYLKEWNAIKEPLESVLGLESIGFDPGFLMRAKDQPYSAPVDIPVWLAKRIVAAIGAAHD